MTVPPTGPRPAAPGSPTRLVIAAGLGVGVVFGFGGSFLPVGPAQNLSEAISSLGLILGAALLAARFAREGRDTVAVGLGLLALAEGVLMSGGTAADAGASASFAAGTALYVVALLLTSLPRAFPTWSRVLGALAAIPFAIHAGLRMLGGAPDPSGPVASTGYGLLSLAMVGWILFVLRDAPPTAEPSW